MNESQDNASGANGGTTPTSSTPSNKRKARELTSKIYTYFTRIEEPKQKLRCKLKKADESDCNKEYSGFAISNAEQV
jgi:hypothetical protein